MADQAKKDQAGSLMAAALKDAALKLAAAQAAVRKARAAVNVAAMVGVGPAVAAKFIPDTITLAPGDPEKVLKLIGSWASLGFVSPDEVSAVLSAG